MATRREVLLAAPALAIAPAVAQAAPRPSPLRAMYQEWQATKDAYNAECDSVEPEEAKLAVVFRRMSVLEERAAAFVPETMEDFALKVIFADDDGDMNMNDAQKALAKLAYQMAGLAPGKWSPGFSA